MCRLTSIEEQSSIVSTLHVLFENILYKDGGITVAGDE
jgi:hypothetical protein